MLVVTPVSRIGRLVGRREERTERTRGFITTRFINAESSEFAAQEALRSVREELQPLLRNSPSDPPRLAVTETWIGDSSYVGGGSGSGFTFY